MSVFLRHLTLTFSLATAISLTWVPAHCATGANTQGWEFNQISLADGKITVVVCDTGVKLVQGDVVSVSCAPDWKVTMVNTKVKTGIEFTLNDWKQVGDHLSREIYEHGPASTRPQKWKGLPTTCITRTVSSSDPMREKVEMGFQSGSERSASFNAEEVVFSDWFKVKPEVVIILSHFYTEPDLKSVLLKRTHLYPSGKSDVILNTISCNRIGIDRDEFRAAVKYRKVKTREEVTLENQRRQDTINVITDFFGGDPKQEKPRAK